MSWADDVLRDTDGELRGVGERQLADFIERGMRASQGLEELQDRIEFERKYGCVDRILFVKSLRCVWCNKFMCENAHTANEGKGRKGHYTTIVPLCGITWMDGAMGAGCHRKYDLYLPPFHNPIARGYVALHCERTEESWLVQQARLAKLPW